MSSDNQDLLFTDKDEWYSTIQAEPTPESVKGEQAKIKLKQLGYVWCESRADYVMRPMKRLIDEIGEK